MNPMPIPRPPIAAGIVTAAAWLLLASGAAPATHAVGPGESIQEAVRRAAPGDTIRVMPGEYHETVYVDTNDLTLEGVVVRRAWPVLDGKHRLNDGVLVAGHGVTVRNLVIRGFKGNAIMTQGANNFRIVRNRVEGPAFYGIFPQFGKNGFVGHNVVTGVEDAGIYVGMSQNVDVVGNEVFGNVLGIETENSIDMLVEGNYVHDNTLGVMLSLVPGLPIKVARRTIVRNNFIVDNNLENFAPEGTPASNVPRGMGGIAYAYDESTWENNVIRGNHSGGIGFMDHSFIPMLPDPKSDPRPDGNRVLHNVFLDNGKAPYGDIAELMQVVGREDGVDVIATGKGRKNCLIAPDSVTTLGTERWEACPPDSSTAAIATMQLREPAPAVTYDSEQIGRMTYLAVCTGCHSYSSRIIGPPMVTAKALYRGKPQALADWIADPVRKREDYPEMPPQSYLPPEVRLAVAKYILGELKQ